MRKRTKKLMSLVLASAMAISFPFADGAEYAVVAYAAETGETDGLVSGAGGG